MNELKNYLAARAALHEAFDYDEETRLLPIEDYTHLTWFDCGHAVVAAETLAEAALGAAHVVGAADDERPQTTWMKFVQIPHEETGLARHESADRKHVAYKLDALDGNVVLGVFDAAREHEAPASPDDGDDE